MERNCLLCGVGFEREPLARKTLCDYCRPLSRKRANLKASQKYRKDNAEKERLRFQRRRLRPGYDAAARKARDPFKERARRALRNAVGGGKLKKPKDCEDCGWTGILHGHHEDYNKALEVKWLCSICHGLRHRASEARLNAALAEANPPKEQKP